MYDEKIIREIFREWLSTGECEGCKKYAVEINIGDLYRTRLKNYAEKSINKTVLEDFPQLCVNCQVKANVVPKAT